MIPEAWLWKAIEEATGVPTHPAYVPRGAVPPYVVFARGGTARDRHTRGNAGVPVASITAMVVAGNYLLAKQLANRVRLAVDGKTVADDDGGEIKSVALVDESDADPEMYAGDDRPTYAVNLSFDVRFTEET